MRSTLRIFHVAFIFTLLLTLTYSRPLSVQADDDTAALARLSKARDAVILKLEAGSSTLAKVNGEQRALALRVDVLQNTLSSLADLAQTLQDESARLAQAVNQTQAEVDLIDARIAQSELQLAANEERLRLANTALAVAHAQLAADSRLTYRLGVGDVGIQALFSAEDIGQLLARVRASLYISARDGQILEEVSTLQQLQRNQLALSEQTKLRLVSLRADALRSRSKLEDQQQAQRSRINSLAHSASLTLSNKAAADAAYADRDTTKSQLNVLTKQLRESQAALDLQMQQVQERIALKAATDARFKQSGVPKGFDWPLYGPVTSWYGWRTDPWPSFHNGIDLAASRCAPVRAAANGIVLVVGKPYGDGTEVVIVGHTKNASTVYAHLTDRAPCPPAVREGQVVSRGDVVGYIGTTGPSTGPHLHFMLSLDGKFVDPSPYLP